jgi:hypothetical protein
MQAEIRDLVLLAALSLGCAGFAWTMDNLVFSAIFFVLGAIAIIDAAETYWH